jgi:cobalt-zinc-cadmium efflux system outer membrane protein
MRTLNILPAIALFMTLAFLGAHAAEAPEVVEQAGPLTIEDALALTLLHSPELEAFSYEVRASEARELQAKKFPNPELDVRLYRLGIPRRFSEPDEERTRMILRQELELGGKRSKRTDLARAERDIAGWDYEAKRLEVSTAVTCRFAALLGAQRRLDSLQKTVDFFALAHGRVMALVEGGNMRTLEGHQSRRQVALARIALQEAESALAVARFSLAATWDSRTPLFSEAVGDLEQIEAVPPLVELLELSRQSPTIARWESEVARSEAALAVAHAERMPNLSVGAGARWEDDAGGRDWLLDLEIALPIFDTKKAGVREGRHNLARAESERKAAEAESDVMLAEVYYRLQASRSRALTLHDEVIPAAQATVEAFRLGFETDTAAPGDLFDATRDLTRAEGDYIDALVEQSQALATLEGIVGRPFITKR